MSLDQFEQTVSQEREELEQLVTHGEIWRELSRVDVSEKIEVKGSGSYQLKYLSWAWAWGVLMEKYPTATYEFMRPEMFADGSCEVWVVVNICGNKREMWLPVMDHKNQAIKNPNSRDISDTRMRCLVKCLAMFGLGHYIYAGEDLPIEKSVNSELISEIKQLIERTDANEASLLAYYKVSSINDMSEKSAIDCLGKLKAKVKNENN